MSVVAWRDRKLLLSELHFYVLYWDPIQDPTPLVVYCTKSVPYHLPLLASLLPDFRFEVFCPAKDKKLPVFPSNVAYYQAQIGHDDLLDYRDREATFLVTADTKNRYLKVQLEWLREIQPKQSFLSYRGAESYPEGTMYNCPWGEGNDMEARIVPNYDPSGIYPEKRNKVEEIHNALMDYNEARRSELFINPYAYDNELIGDMDSAIEGFILNAYLTMTENRDGDIPAVIELSKRITKALRTQKNFNLALGRRGSGNTFIEQFAKALHTRDWEGIKRALLSPDFVIDDTQYRWKFQSFYYGDRLHNDSGLLFRAAVASGSPGVVEILLREESLNPIAMDCIALQDATLSGKTAIVKQLAAAKTVRAPIVYNTQPTPWSLYEIWRLYGDKCFDESFHSVMNPISRTLAKSEAFQSLYRNPPPAIEGLPDTPFHRALVAHTRLDRDSWYFLATTLSYRQRLAVERYLASTRYPPH